MLYQLNVLKEKAVTASAYPKGIGTRLAQVEVALMILEALLTKNLPRLTLIWSLILNPAVTTPSLRRDPRPR
jgi:hypothetical protein